MPENKCVCFISPDKVKLRDRWIKDPNQLKRLAKKNLCLGMLLFATNTNPICTLYGRSTSESCRLLKRKISQYVSQLPVVDSPNIE